MASNPPASNFHFVAHVGASWIGTECQRELWMRYRNVYYPHEAPPPVAPNGIDICTIGKLAEPKVVDVLRGKGYTVYTTPHEARDGGYAPAQRWSIDPTGGEDDQMHVLHPDHPHISGYLDGIVILGGKPAILEIKTMACHKFYRCTQEGIRAVYPGYYAQIQTYMYLCGIYRGMFVYTVRGDDGTVSPDIDFFLATEIIDYDDDFAKQTVLRAERIVEAKRLPPAKKSCPSYCRYYAVCKHLTADPSYPIPTCRSCRRLGDKCPHEQTLQEGILTVCGFYSPIPDVMPAEIRKSYFVDEPDDDTSLARYLDTTGTYIDDSADIM